MGRARVIAWTLAAGALCAAGGALAHDSWLAPASSSVGGTALVFSTGNRYPRGESAPAPDSVAAAACVDGKGQRHKLNARAGRDPVALGMQSTARGPAACWATLHPHEVTLDARLVDVYFREIRPPAEIRAAYAEQAQRGHGWHETYTKFARIERSNGRTPPEALRHLRAPAGLPLEVVILGDQPVAAGAELAFQVLASGRPVPGLALELVSERNPLGIWTQADAQGRIRFTPPFAGAWLVRGTLVEPEGAPGRWRSRFVTLAFEAN
jgi:hypothetical protein